jgi:hypothetical protein
MDRDRIGISKTELFAMLEEEELKKPGLFSKMFSQTNQATLSSKQIAINAKKIFLN